MLEHETDVNFKSLNEKQILLRDFFAVLALSFHAVFEGLAIGLESDLTKIWILFAGMFKFTEKQNKVFKFIFFIYLCTFY